MHSKFLLLLCTLFCTLLSLTSCKNYSVSLNDKVVYTPPTLFTDYAVKDARLKTCIEQTIIDKQISKAEDLKQLNCSNAGIRSLAGIETFSAIEQLNLDDNALTSVSELSQLPQVRVLSLKNNSLTDAEPLLRLLHLTTLDVSHNKNLKCNDLKQLITNFPKGELSVVLPQQCSGT